MGSVKMKWFLYENDGHEINFFEKEDIGDIAAGVYGNQRYIGCLETEMLPEDVKRTFRQRQYDQIGYMKDALEHIQKITKDAFYADDKF